MYLPSLALAQSSTSSAASTKELLQERKTAVQNSRIDSLKTRATQEIDRRIKALTYVITRINNLKHITAAQKTAYTTQIQTEIINLNTLNTKIQADTTLEALKPDVKSIVDSYRIYALFIPQIHILAASDSMLQTTNQASELATKLETRIQEAQSQGRNVSLLTTTLADMRAKIEDAVTQATSASTIVTVLTPDGYPGNKTTLKSGRSMLVAGKQSLLQARRDATTIIQGLRALGTSTVPSASISAHP